MKRKITIIDLEGKKTEKEFKVRNYEMYAASLKYKSSVYKDKTKYNRKEKHKKRISDDSL